MNGKTIKGIMSFLALSALAGAANSIGSHLGIKCIEKIRTLKEQAKKKKLSEQNKIIKFKKIEP